MYIVIIFVYMFILIVDIRVVGKCPRWLMIIISFLHYMKNNTHPPHDESDVSDVSSEGSHIDVEEQRQLDIEAIHDLVASNQNTRHFESITEGNVGGMMISPDGIVVTIESDGSKSVKFSNINHEAVPQWYIDEHNETVSKRIASLESLLAKTQKKLDKENTIDASKEKKVLKTIDSLQKKARQSDKTEQEIEKLEKIIEDLSSSTLLSARGCNEALKSKYSNKITKLESMLENARKTLK